MKTIIKTLLCAIACLFAISSNACGEFTAPDKKLQVFYQQPNYSDLIYITSEVTKENDDMYTFSMMQIFTALAIDSHPEYIQEIVDNFSKYSDKEKYLLYMSLSSADQEKAITQINTKYKYKKPIKKNFKVSSVKKLESNTSEQIDIIWAAYYATGQNLYLEKILTFLSENTLDASANFKFYDIQPGQQVSGSQTINPVVSAALWSLESNRKNVPEIDKTVDALIQKNPQWDYRKRMPS